jgi:hypothetical protein
MQQAVIHCKESYLDELLDLNVYFEYGDGEIDVIVNDVEFDSLTDDPDVLLCDHYGIDYDQVNCIELA